MGSDAQVRVRHDVVRLVHKGLTPREFSLAVAHAIRPAVAFDGVCVLMFDPATMLQTGDVVENGLPESVYPRMTEIEFAERDFNKFADLAREIQPAASLYEATEGDLDRSLRQREVRGPNGWLGDELRAALVSNTGTWGGLTLLRESGPAFNPDEVKFVASLSRHLADGIRRSILLSAVVNEPTRSDAGLLILTQDNSVEMANAAAQTWLEQLGFDSDSVGPLPPVIQAVVSRARSADGGDDSLRSAGARVRTRSGLWLLLRGSILGEPPFERVAVILEPAQRPSLASLIVDAYGLTDSERAVTESVAQGLSTNDIATRLHLSRYTVQDHLKSIFEKTGVRSRGELVAQLFITHHGPRLTNGIPVAPSGWFER
ncbi:helix-turn-helix transcriptional regulator [Mycobacterium sp. LTG2003]